MPIRVLLAILFSLFILPGCPGNDDDDSTIADDDDDATPGDDDDTTSGDDDDATPGDDDDATPGDDDDATPADDDDSGAGDDDDSSVGDDDDTTAGDDDDDDTTAGDDDDDDTTVGDDDDSANPAAVSVPGDYADIQSAIDLSVDGAVVEVGAGTYFENLDFGGKALHIRGVDGMAATVIDGGGNGPVVRFASGEGPDSVLEGFTLTNGNGQLTIDEDGGHTPCGGGVFLRGASPTLLGLAIVGNHASDGGGLFLTDGAAPALSNVTVEDNVASDDGGGLYVWGSAPVLNHVRIAGNVAQGEDGGGMVAKENSAPMLTNVVFAGNVAPDDGGALRLKNSDSDLLHVAFVGNHAGDGGALAVKGCTATMTGVIMAYNVASSQGGGVYEKGGGSANLGYSNAWDNAPNNYDGAGGMVDPTGTFGNVSVDPGFLDVTAMDAADWDLHLTTTSPMIDAGDPAVLDPDGSRGDIGAFGGPDAAGWDLDHDGYPLWWLPGPFDAATSPGMDCDDTDDAVHPGNGC
jgi:hypothetical protein